MTSPQLEDVITDVYRTLAEGSTSKSPAVLIIDEFQELPTLGEHLPGLFKSLMDQHPGVSLVIAGSKQHLIERLVLERNAPLFGMLATVTLGEIPRAEMSAFLRRRATRGRKRMSEEVAEAIVAVVGPAPNDIQHLAYEAFNAAAGAVITQQHVRRGLDLAAQHGSTVFQSRFDSCSDGQKRVLLELAQRPTKSVFGADFRDAVRLKSSGSVRNAVAALVEQDLVAQRDGVNFVADPFMAEWLRSIAQS